MIVIGITVFVSLNSIIQGERIVDEKIIIEKTLDNEGEIKTDEDIFKEIDGEIKTDEDIFKEIDEKYKKIEEKSNNSTYIQKEREWQSSGPFKIDRKEYALGEKIFLQTENLRVDERGEIVFLRFLNNTHLKVWQTFPFNGEIKPAFNIYFEPRISKIFGICDKDDLIGDWVVHFRGTGYPDLTFSITEQILTGDELDFSERVC